MRCPLPVALGFHRGFRNGLLNGAAFMGRGHVGFVVCAAKPKGRQVLDDVLLAALGVDRLMADAANAIGAVEDARALQAGDAAALHAATPIMICTSRRRSSLLTPGRKWREIRSQTRS